MYIFCFKVDDRSSYNSRIHDFPRSSGVHTQKTLDSFFRVPSLVPISTPTTSFSSHDKISSVKGNIQFQSTSTPSPTSSRNTQEDIERLTAVFNLNRKVKIDAKTAATWVYPFANEGSAFPHRKYQLVH